jgi:hypothetical protein
MVTQPIRIVGVVAGLPWGGLGVAAGYTVSLLIISLITLRVAGRLVEMQITTIFRTLFPTLVSALMMAVLVWLMRPVLDLENELLLFLVQTTSGVVIYWTIVALIKIKAYQDVISVFHEEITSWRRGDSHGK